MDGSAQDPRQECLLFSLQLVALGMLAGREAEVLAPQAAPLRVQEQHVAEIGVIDEQGAQRGHRDGGRCGIAAGGVEVDVLGPGKAGGIGRGPLQRLDPPGRLARQVEALDQVSARLQERDLLDVDQPAAGQDVEPAQQLGHAGEQDAADLVVEGLGLHAGGAVADLAVAMPHQPVEQLADADPAP